MSYHEDLDFKRRFLADEPPGERMITQLLGLIVTRPQPLDFVEKVLTAARAFHKSRGFKWFESQDPRELTRPDDQLVAQAMEVISSIRDEQHHKLDRRINRRVSEDFSGYLQAVTRELKNRKEQLLGKTKEKRDKITGKVTTPSRNKDTYELRQRRIYTGLARRLNVMNLFQDCLRQIRREIQFEPHFPTSLEEIANQSPDDLLYATLYSPWRDRTDQLPYVYGEIHRLCRIVGLDPDRDAGLVIAFLCFGPLTKDGDDNPSQLIMILHFATQQPFSGINKLDLSFDDAGLIGGLLLALAHCVQLIPEDSDLPDAVNRWVDKARALSKDLNVTPADAEKITSMMTQIGGNLDDLRPSEARINVEIAPAMLKKHLDAIWQSAHMMRFLIRGEPKKAERDVERWKDYATDMRLWHHLQRSTQNSDYGRIHDAMRDYDQERIDRGLDPLYGNRGATEYDNARKIVNKVQRYIDAKTLDDDADE